MRVAGLTQEKKAYFIRKSAEPQLHEVHNALRLFGSDAYAAGNGDILYITYRNLAKSEAIPPAYILVSSHHPQADIYAAESRTRSFQELRINRVTGGVEAAIRSMDHIVEVEKEHEAPQLQTLASRAHELFDLFSTDYPVLTKKELESARQKTYRLLATVRLDPERIVDEEKKRITDWLIKGSYGHDILGRKNELISIMTLSAAYRHAVEKWKGIGPILGKFIRMREALIFERSISRTLFTEAELRLRDNAIPAASYFRNPGPRTLTNAGYIIGILETTRFQLTQPHVNPYRARGQEAAAIIKEIIQQMKNGDNLQLGTAHRFRHARDIIARALAEYSLIYPSVV